MPRKSRDAIVEPAAWLFDFDNTLARLEPEVDWARGRTVLEPFLRSAGAPETLFAEIPRGNLPLYEAYRFRFGAQNRQVLVRASAIIEEFELEGIDRAAPLPGAIELIESLRAIGAPIAIVTSNSSRTIARWLLRHGVEDAIATTVGRDSMLALKPSPAPVMRALALLARAAGNAIFIGDSEADRIAADSAGIEFVGIAQTDAARDKLVAGGATEIYSSPAALAIHRGIAPRSRPAKSRTRLA
jgi:phosphoglycolate phosphatase